MRVRDKSEEQKRWAQKLLTLGISGFTPKWPKDSSFMWNFLRKLHNEYQKHHQIFGVAPKKKRLKLKVSGENFSREDQTHYQSEWVCEVGLLQNGQKLKLYVKFSPQITQQNQTHYQNCRVCEVSLLQNRQKLKLYAKFLLKWHNKIKWVCSKIAKNRSFTRNFSSNYSNRSNPRKFKKRKNTRNSESCNEKQKQST